MQHHQHPSSLHNIRGHLTAYSPTSVVSTQLSATSSAASSAHPPLPQHPAPIDSLVASEVDSRALATSSHSRRPQIYAQNRAAVPPHIQAQPHAPHNSSVDPRWYSGEPAHPAQGNAPSTGPSNIPTQRTTRPLAQPAANNALFQPPGHLLANHAQVSATNPQNDLPPTVPIPAPPPEIAPMFHPSVDLPAIQRRMEDNFSHIGVNLGTIWSHIIESTTMEIGKYRSDALRWKERCLNFEEAYKQCKQKLDSMSHENIMLQTQINRLQQELIVNSHPQGHAVPTTQAARHPSKVQNMIVVHGVNYAPTERRQTTASVNPTPVATIAELPAPTHTKGDATVDLSDKETITAGKVASHTSDTTSLAINAPVQATPSVPALTPPQEPHNPVMTPPPSSPEASTRKTSPPKAAPTPPPTSTYGISGFLPPKPPSIIRTVTPVKPRSSASSTTDPHPSLISVAPKATATPFQTSAQSARDDNSNELEEGEVSPEAQVPETSPEPAQQAPDKRRKTPGPVPPLALYMNPQKVISSIPKKRPLDVEVEGPVKKVKSSVPMIVLSQPVRKIGGKSYAPDVKPGSMEESDRMAKTEPISPSLPARNSISARSTPAQSLKGHEKPPYHDTAVLAPDPPAYFEYKGKSEFIHIAPQHLRKQGDRIYCHECVCEYERDPTHPVTRFSGGTLPSVLYHFESQHGGWWKKVQSQSSN